MIIYSIEELPDSSFGVCKWEVTPWVGHPGGYFFVVQIVDESRYGQVRIYGEHERSDFEKDKLIKKGLLEPIPREMSNSWNK